MCCFLHINISDICACLVFLRWQPLQSLPWTLRHDQKHICANLILRVAFIRHADCCSGIFLFLILSLPPSFLLFSLHHRSQGFPLLFTCFFSPPNPPSASPFPLLAPSHSRSPPFFFLHPGFDSGCASLGGEDGAPPDPGGVLEPVGTLVSASPCVGIVSAG